MRLFVAVNLPPVVRERIHADYATLRDAAPDISWTRPELLHFTIKFLGETDEQRALSLGRALADAASRRRPFAVKLASAGAFPNFARPRVVWIGVNDQRRLAELAEDVEQACALLGFERDARSFTAHVTLGRVRRPLARGAARTLERAARGVHNEYPIDVTSIDLMLSQPGAHGSIYTVLAAAPLGGG